MGPSEPPQGQHQHSLQAPIRTSPTHPLLPCRVHTSACSSKIPPPLATPPLATASRLIPTTDSPPPAPEALCPGLSPDPRTPPFAPQRGPCARLEGLSSASGHSGSASRDWAPCSGPRNRAPGAVSSFSAFSACLSKPESNTKDPRPISPVSPASTKELQTPQESAGSGWQCRPLKARGEQTLTVQL